jgi:peroxiredoxin
MSFSSLFSINYVTIIVIMKIFTFLLLAASFSLATALNAAVDSGSAAPDFTLTDSTGASHSLSDFAGKYVILEWTNHQCPFVVKHYKNGDMQALQKAMTDDGAIWLQIISSAEGKQGYLKPEAAEELRASQEVYSTALLMDTAGEVGRAYDARVTPHMYLIDPDGILVYQGAIDSIRSTKPEDVAKAENYLKAAYESSKAGEPIANATTVAYGCSVKY